MMRDIPQPPLQVNVLRICLDKRRFNCFGNRKLKGDHKLLIGGEGKNFGLIYCGSLSLTPARHFGH